MSKDTLRTCLERLRELVGRFDECLRLHDCDPDQRLADLESIAVGAHVINRRLNDFFLSGEAPEDELEAVINAANEAGRLALRARRAQRE